MQFQKDLLLFIRGDASASRELIETRVRNMDDLIQFMDRQFSGDLLSVKRFVERAKHIVSTAKSHLKSSEK